MGPRLELLYVKRKSVELFHKNFNKNCCFYLFFNVKVDLGFSDWDKLKNIIKPWNRYQAKDFFWRGTKKKNNLLRSSWRKRCTTNTRSNSFIIDSAVQYLNSRINEILSEDINLYRICGMANPVVLKRKVHRKRNLQRGLDTARILRCDWN